MDPNPPFPLSVLSRLCQNTSITLILHFTDQKPTIKSCYLEVRQVVFSIINLIFEFWCFKTTFCNISAISYQTVLVVEEAGAPVENP